MIGIRTRPLVFCGARHVCLHTQEQRGTQTLRDVGSIPARLGRMAWRDRAMSMWDPGTYHATEPAGRTVGMPTSRFRQELYGSPVNAARIRPPRPCALCAIVRRSWTATLRLTYAEFFERCDRWSAALQRLGRRARATGSPTSRPTPTRSSRRSTPCRRSAPCWCRSTIRLTADDFAYIISHSGARVVCAHADYLDAGRPHPRRAARRRALRRARRRARRAGSTTSRLLADAAPDFEPPEIERERPAHDQLHQRHDRAAQGRDDHAPQRLHERRRHPAPRRR